MDINRVREEISRLDEAYPVKFGLEDGWVMITKFGYPSGWTPRTAPLFFSLPTGYPRYRPDVFLPPDQRYNEQHVIHQLRPNDDGWRKWCIDELDWRPYDRDLYWLTEVMKRSLAKPYKSNPLGRR